MNKIVTVESLKEGDRFEFLTTRSEWADRCFLPHPQGVVIVARTAFLDPYNQCRFGWRLEKYPNSRPQDWWGVKHTEVRLLGRTSSATTPEGKPEKRTAAATVKPATVKPGRKART